MKNGKNYYCAILMPVASNEIPKILNSTNRKTIKIMAEEEWKTNKWQSMLIMDITGIGLLDTYRKRG